MYYISQPPAGRDSGGADTSPFVSIKVTEASYLTGQMTKSSLAPPMPNKHALVEIVFFQLSALARRCVNMTLPRTARN